MRYSLYLFIIFLLLFCSILLNCKSNENFGLAEFVCIDQSGTLLDNVEVVINGKKQKSDDQGICQIRFPMNDSNSIIPIEANIKDYQFIDPDTIYLKRGQIVRYAMKFLNDDMLSSINRKNIENKVIFNFNYPDTKQEIVEPDIKLDDVVLPPPPIYVTLKVESVPTGSYVTIKKKKRTIVNRRKTPYSQRLKYGKYRLHAVSELGYMSEIRNIQLSSNKTFTITHRILPATITIKTEPEGAYVYVNGRKEIGATPLQITLREEGAYNLKIERKGFHVENRKINFGPGDGDTEFLIKLKGLLHNVTFRLKEKGKITIDGVLINKKWGTRIETRLTAGKHKIEILYKKKKRKITHDDYFIKGIEGWPYEL